MKTDHSTTLPATTDENPFRAFLNACGTFASNVVERFHEYADARLAEELTIAEQRKRLLAPKNAKRAMRPRALAHRVAHVD